MLEPRTSQELLTTLHLDDHMVRIDEQTIEVRFVDGTSRSWHLRADGLWNPGRVRVAHAPEDDGEGEP